MVRTLDWHHPAAATTRSARRWLCDDWLASANSMPSSHSLVPTNACSSYRPRPAMALLSHRTVPEDNRCLECHHSCETCQSVKTTDGICKVRGAIVWYPRFLLLHSFPTPVWATQAFLRASHHFLYLLSYTCNSALLFIVRHRHASVCRFFIPSPLLLFSTVQAADCWTCRAGRHLVPTSAFGTGRCIPDHSQSGKTGPGGRKESGACAVVPKGVASASYHVVRHQCTHYVATLLHAVQSVSWRTACNPLIAARVA